MVLAQYTDPDRYDEDRLRGRIPRPGRCIHCGHARVWFNGSYPRYVNLLRCAWTCLRRLIHVVRCRCAACSRGFALLPGFVRRRCQFGFDFMEAVLRLLCCCNASWRKALESPESPSERTVRRWIKRMLVQCTQPQDENGSHERTQGWRDRIRRRLERGFMAGAEFLPAHSPPHA